MSGAERRRRRRQRTMAVRAARDPQTFVRDVNDEVLRMHRFARSRASRLRTATKARMPLSAGIAELAARLDADLIAVEAVLRRVFVDRVASADVLGLDAAEAAGLAPVAKRAAGLLRGQLRGRSIEAEVSDTAASAFASVADRTLHRLVWGRYDKGMPADSDARRARERNKR